MNKFRAFAHVSFFLLFSSFAFTGQASGNKVDRPTMEMMIISATNQDFKETLCRVKNAELENYDHFLYLNKDLEKEEYCLYHKKGKEYKKIKKLKTEMLTVDFHFKKIKSRRIDPMSIDVFPLLSVGYEGLKFQLDPSYKKFQVIGTGSVAQTKNLKNLLLLNGVEASVLSNPDGDSAISIEKIGKAVLFFKKIK